MASIAGQMQAVSSELGFEGKINAVVARALLQSAPWLSSMPGHVMIFNWLYSGARTAFLQDANTPVMPGDRLSEVLRYLRRAFPTLERVTSYARSKTLARKSVEELKALREAGLDRLHVGLETGDPELLAKVKKGVSAQEHILGGKKAMEVGFQLSEYWMPGLGGLEQWQQHARNTARVLNAIDPHYIRSRPFSPAPGTPLYEAFSRGELTLLSPMEQLVELRCLVEDLNVHSRLCFDHSANCWPNTQGGLLLSQDYEGYRLPEDKARVLRLIEEGIQAQAGRPKGRTPRILH